jgi:YVTN family beta-propeller protein
MSHPRRIIAVASALALALAAADAAAAPARRKLYVANGGGDDVSVIDAATHQVLGRIEVGLHPQGIAAPASQDVIYVTIDGGKAGELLWIDPRSDAVTKRLAVGPKPNQLAVTPDGRFAYVPCRDGYWDVVDLGAARVVTRIFTGGRPHNTLASADGARMYLAPMGAPKQVTIVEVATHTPVGTIAFSDVVRPVALASDEKRLYAEVDGLVGIEVADVAARKMIQRVPATLTEGERTVASRSHGIGIRPDQRELWECDVEHRDVHVYDVSGDRPRQIATVPVGGRPFWLTFSPDGKVCYVSTSGTGAGEVAAVDTETKKVVARMTVGKDPERSIVVTLPER